MCLNWNSITNRMREIWNFRVMFFTSAFACLGVLMTLWEILGLFCKFDKMECEQTISIIAGFIIIIVSFVYAYRKLFCRKDYLELEINKRTSLYVKKENLMAVNGVKVIPVNEYFDTHNGDGIINPYSLHGQFLSLFDGRIEELRQQIESQLSQMQPLPSNRQRSMVPGLPQVRYPLGTCIRITDNGNTYMLVAVTRFDQNEHVDVATEEYPEIIRKMYNGIEHIQDGNPVYLPLIGSGISGYQLTNMQLLDTLVQMAHNADRLAVTKGIHICIYNAKQMDSLNLNIIEYLYNRWKTLK